MGISKLQPIKIRRLSEIIEESIKDLILSGDLKVGSRLPAEKEIAKQFGVSIVTVREALRGLESFGVIRKKRGKQGGIFVSQTERQIVKNAAQMFLKSEEFSADDLNQVRIIIEPSCVRIAAARISQSELKAIDKNIKYCEDQLEKRKHAFSEKEFFDIEERNVEFHRLLAEATHNPILALTVDYVEDFLLSFKKANLVADYQFSQNIVRDHRRIYDAVKNRDAELAEQELLSHIGAVGIHLQDGSKLKPKNP